ncbi:MAG: 50S ribosomal protein L5 [Candidatus Sumerlaeota bacterium]|nr:50S ribosomal protein L5 [Candidatus Sumerlaeota bacterium]
MSEEQQDKTGEAAEPQAAEPQALEPKAAEPKAPKGKAKGKGEDAAEPKAAKGKGAEAKAAEPKAAGGKGKAKAAEPSEDAEALKGYVPRLKDRYNKEIRAALTEKFGYKNPMQIPRLLKVTVSMGVGEGTRDIKLLDAAEQELSLITGQKPKRTRARKSVANFKLRAGMPIGCFVTLRGYRMYEFLDRLITVAIPRIRDFRGLPSRSFDGRGNHSMGIREHLIFMELDHNKVAKDRGLNIATITSAKTDEEALELLRQFGMPFREI